MGKQLNPSTMSDYQNYSDAELEHLKKANAIVKASYKKATALKDQAESLKAKAERLRKTIDLRKVIPVDAELQHVVLRCDNSGFAVCVAGLNKFKQLEVSKSLRYVRHSDTLGVLGASMLQLSLALCLELYPVSVAIRIHRIIAANHLVSLPVIYFGGSFRSVLWCSRPFRQYSRVHWYKSLYLPLSIQCEGCTGTCDKSCMIEKGGSHE